MQISLCMIVKNEGDCIARCLSSVQGVVDEIIVVDTGCTDDTVSICRRFGTSVLLHTWQEDFSAARNAGLERAKGDFILWLDADEEFEREDGEILREAIHSGESDFYALRLINYYGNTPKLEESYQISHLRVFKNHKGYRFVNRIHEKLDVSEVEKVVSLPVRVHHYGYMPSAITGKGKQARNVELLKKELEDPNCNPWIHYHIAAECCNLKQYDVALNQLNFGILKFVLRGLKPPSMAYRLKYVILHELGKVEFALLNIDKAIAMYPDYVDLHFLKGLFLMESKRYEDAAGVFSKCLSLGEDNENHLILKGVGSFRAQEYREICLEKAKKLE